MARYRLFEFEDFDWFPTILRNYCTDFLQFLSNNSGMYKLIMPVLLKGLEKSKSNHIIDLASGGGGGILWINKSIKQQFPFIRITLTDYFPNLPAFAYMKSKADNIDYIDTSVDARDIPDHLRGFRMQLLSLHHFEPLDATLILQNAVNSKNPIFIAEGQERSIHSLLAMLISPVMVWLTTPFIRPFSARRLLFTYIIPIVPLVIWWDGISSALRTYSVKEMEKLVNGLKNKESFEWEIGKVRSGPATILYLLGTVNEKTKQKHSRTVEISADQNK